MKSSDRENEDDLVDTSRLKRFSRLVRALLNGSSIKYAESKAVVTREQELQLASISDMAMRSPNPIVADIALQSLAGLHKMESGPEIIPLELWKRIDSTMKNSDYFSSGRKKYDASSPHYSAAERMTRAFLCRSDLRGENISYERARIFVERSPDDMKSIALMAILIRERAQYLTMNTLMARLISHSSVEIHKCPPWIYRQVIQTVSRVGFSPFESDHSDDVSPRCFLIWLRISPLIRGPTSRAKLFFIASLHVRGYQLVR
jgi:hypothetical protein